MRHIDKNTFGPWAIVTGASLGIGQEFARQLAQAGLNLVLVARRLPRLEALGAQLEKEYDVHYRAVGLDLAQANLPMKLMSPGQCAAEGLAALSANRATHIAGRLNRIMAAVVPRRVVGRMFGSMMRQTVERRSIKANAQAEHVERRDAHVLREQEAK